MTTGTVTLHRVIRAPAERIYRAFLDAEALCKWMPPHGFTAKVHHLEATVGGTYKMSFTNFSNGHTHSFGGKYLELIPNERICNTDQFDDSTLPGEMRTLSKLKFLPEHGASRCGQADAKSCAFGSLHSLRSLRRNLPSAFAWINSDVYRF